MAIFKIVPHKPTGKEKATRILTVSIEIDTEKCIKLIEQAYFNLWGKQSIYYNKENVEYLSEEIHRLISRELIDQNEKDYGAK
jgi:hypothetical protein